ncbi:hypothetical protein, partial [Microbacterium marmarense]
CLESEVVDPQRNSRRERLARPRQLLTPEIKDGRAAQRDPAIIVSSTTTREEMNPNYLGTHEKLRGQNPDVWAPRISRAFILCFRPLIAKKHL